MQKSINLTEEKRNNYTKKFWLMMCLFYALFIARNVLHIQFPVVFYLGWVAVMALVFDDNEIKALVISFIPLSAGFQFKYAIFICLVALIIKNFNRFRINSIAVLGVALMIWELLHFGIGSPSIIEFLRGFAEIMFIVAVVCLPSKRKQSISELTRVFAISSTVAFVILLFVTVTGRGQSILELMQNGFRFGVSETDAESFTFNYNANALGFICNIAVSGLLLNVYNKSAKVVDYLMIAFLIFIGLLTVSRTFILCLGITVVLYVLLQRRRISRKILTVLSLTIAGAIMLVIIVNYFPSIIDNYTDRFGAEDVTNGRSYLFEFYNDFILSSADRLFFGIGIQGIHIKVGEIMGLTVNVPHNGYQQLVVAWGIPGFVLMALFVYKLVKQAKRKKKVPLLYYLPLLLLVINILAGQFVTVSAKVLSLIFIFEILSNSDYSAGGKKNAERTD